MQIVLEVPGQPVPQPRARVTRKGWAYTDKKHPIHAYRQAIELLARGSRIEGPVVVNIDAVFSRPPSHWRAHDLRPNAPGWPRADIDNIEKGIYDALTDAGVWDDDDQIVDGRTRKRWAARSEPARTIITIERAAI